MPSIASILPIKTIIPPMPPTSTTHHIPPINKLIKRRTTRSIRSSLHFTRTMSYRCMITNRILISILIFCSTILLAIELLSIIFVVWVGVTGCWVLVIWVMGVAGVAGVGCWVVGEFWVGGCGGGGGGEGGVCGWGVRELLLVFVDFFYAVVD